MKGLLMILLTLLACAANSAGARQSADDLMRIGDAGYSSFDTPAAISAFEAAHTLEPSNPEILVRLARSWNDRASELNVLGRSEEALAAATAAELYARRLTTEYPNDARSWFYLAAAVGTRALFSDGREKIELGRDVERYCQRSIELDGEYALPHLALGMYYREVAGLSRIRRFLANRLLGRLPDRPERRALTHLAVAERLSPDLPVIVFQRARTLEQFGHLDEARASYRRLVDMPPLNARDVRNLREARARLGIKDTDTLPSPDGVRMASQR